MSPVSIAIQLLAHNCVSCGRYGLPLRASIARSDGVRGFNPRSERLWPTYSSDLTIEVAGLLLDARLYSGILARIDEWPTRS